MIRVLNTTSDYLIENSRVDKRVYLITESNTQVLICTCRTLHLKKAMHFSANEMTFIIHFASNCHRLTLCCAISVRLSISMGYLNFSLTLCNKNIHHVILISYWLLCKIYNLNLKEECYG